MQALRRLPLVPEIARQNTEVPPMSDLYATVASQAEYDALGIDDHGLPIRGRPGTRDGVYHHR